MLLLFLERCTDWKHWKGAFSLVVFPSWGFLCTNISGTEVVQPRGAAAHIHLGLVGLNNLKGLCQPEIWDSKTVLTTAATQGLSQHSSHPFPWGSWVGKGHFWLKRHHRGTSLGVVSLHISPSLRALSEKGLFSSQSKEKDPSVRSVESVSASCCGYSNVKLQMAMRKIQDSLGHPRRRGGMSKTGWLQVCRMVFVWMFCL